MTGGRMWSSVSILFCLMATVHPHMHPTKWWLLATVDRSELRDNDNLLPLQCETYTNFTTPSQQDLCFEDRNVMSAVVLGVQRAIYTCQEIFKGCIWNCTAFTEDVLLGRGVEDTATREREFVRMLLAASITYDLTQECIRHNLGNNCFDWSVPFVRRVNIALILNGTVIFGKGGANIEWASSITRRVMESDTDECSDVLTHNIEAGIQLANNTYVHCIELFGSSNNKIKNCIEVVIKQITFVPFINRVNDTLVLGRGGANIKWASSITRRVMESDTDECSDVLTHNIEAGIQLAANTYTHCEKIGLFGSDKIQKCHLDIDPKHFYPYFRSYSKSYKDELVKALRNRYHGAVKVNCQLAPVNGDPPIATSTDVVFTADSPNHCVANPFLDIPGTSGRECDPLATDCNNCAILCCGRGFHTKTVTIVKKEVKIIDVNGKLIPIIKYKNVLVKKHFCN